MSRRESRVSMNVRQNDALLEFENFKKKFLLANKHITKLNSTLSIRIEELNAQISSLYVENLRLRASEIALAAQVKKERERSQRIMADAEIATHTLIKHFSSIRKNFNVPSGKPPFPVKQPPPPKARCRPALNPDASPHVNRLARAPGFPEIHEEDEDEEAGTPSSPTPATRRKKPRASSSSLPSPSPPIVATIQVDVDEQLLRPSPGKKRISRRQSGLINVGASSSTSWAGGRSLSPPRPPSPAFGSPIRLEAGLAEEEEEMAALNGKVDLEDEEEELLLERAMKKERKKKAKAREEAAAESSRTKRRAREEDDSSAASAAEGSKFRLKDVTNSPAARAPLAPLDTHISDNDRQHTPDTDIPTSALTHASTSTRPVLSTPSTTPAPSHLPTPRASSPPPPRASSPPPPVPEPGMPAAGRSGRVRKSVNYAEPKLNTKMRKPDPPGASKRASMSALQPSLDPAPPPDSLKRKKSRPRLPPEDASDGEQADAEFAAGARPGWVNVDGRRRGVRADELRRHSMAM